jgi:hypothetical protein
VDFNRAAFDARSAADALRLIGATAAETSADIVLKTPEIAENGAAVPIEVISNIPGTTRLSVLVDKNPFPLALQFNFAPGRGTLPGQAQDGRKLPPAHRRQRRWQALHGVPRGQGHRRRLRLSTPGETHVRPHQDPRHRQGQRRRSARAAAPPHGIRPAPRRRRASRTGPLHHLRHPQHQRPAGDRRRPRHRRVGQPLFGFQFAGVKAGDKVAIAWLDNKGQRGNAETVFAAG